VFTSYTTLEKSTEKWPLGRQDDKIPGGQFIAQPAFVWEIYRRYLHSCAGKFIGPMVPKAAGKLGII